MDIKLIRNYNGDKCIPVEDSMVLMISDAGYRLNEFTGVQYMLVDVDSNAKQEIMPGTDKFDIYQFTDVTGTHDYITLRQQYAIHQMELLLILYDTI